MAPVYVYECDRGHVTELTCSMEKRKDHIRCSTCAARAKRTIPPVQVLVPEIHKSTYLTNERIRSQLQNINAIEKEMKKGEPITVNSKGVLSVFRNELDRRLTKDGRAS